MQYILVVVSLCGGRNRGEAQYQYHVTTHTVIFVDTFRILDAPEDIGGIVLSDANDRLQEEENVGDETKDGMR